MNKNKVKDICKEYKAAVIIIIPCVMLIFAFVSMIFSEPNDPYKIEFAGNTFEFTDSKDDIKSTYGNAYSETLWASLTNDNDEAIELFFDDEKLNGVENVNRCKSVKIGGISIGDSVEDVASTLKVDEDEFKDNETTLLFYKDKEVKHTERITDDTASFPFEGVISEGKKSDCILSIEIKDSKVKSQAIYSASDYVDTAEEKLEDYYNSYGW